MKNLRPRCTSVAVFVALFLCILGTSMEAGAQTTYAPATLYNPLDPYSPGGNDYLSDPKGYVRMEDVQKVYARQEALEKNAGIRLMGGVVKRMPTQFTATSYATAVAKRWRLKPTDALLLIAADQQSSALWLGEGLLARIPKDLEQRLLAQFLQYYLDAGQISEGYLACTEQILNILEHQGQLNPNMAFQAVTPPEGGIHTLESIPNPKASPSWDYVSDPDGILGGSAEDAINSTLKYLEDSTGIQAVVVAVNSIGSEVPHPFGTELFNKWGIGNRTRNDGLLLFIVLDQKSWRVVTGYGMEVLLPDVSATRLGQETLVARFREGNFGQGAADFMARFSELMMNSTERQAFNQESQSFGYTMTRGDNFFGRNWFWMRWYFYAAGLVGLLGALAAFYGFVAITADPYKQYLFIRPMGFWVWAFVFPVPYLLVIFMVKGTQQYLRNKPRSGPKTGKPMRKLDEKQDDIHLKKGNISEENIESIDYDVWVTEGNEPEVLVLPYKNFGSSYFKCSKCKFRTAHSWSETIEAATYSSSGRGRKTTECKHCNHKTVSYYTIAKLEHSSSSSSSGGGGGGSSFGGGSSGGGGGGGSW